MKKRVIKKVIKEVIGKGNMAVSVLKDKKEVIKDIQMNTESGEVLGYVGIAYGVTVNLGNYESAKVDVRASVPCKVGGIGQEWLDAVQKGYEQLRGLVEMQIKQEIEDIKMNRGL